MAEIILENVSRIYPDGGVFRTGMPRGDGAVVRDLCLEVRDRELLVLVGPSGCGKTTTLRMIAGLEPVTNGSIRIGGRDVRGEAPRKRNLAWAPQFAALYPHLTVHENLVFGLTLRRGRRPTRAFRRLMGGRTTESMDERRWMEQVGEVTRRLGIENLLGRWPWQLSGGERQRVALGRALLGAPAARLLDEPLSNLDAVLRVEIRRALRQWHERRATTTIYVTHDLAEATTIGDRIAVMHAGRLQQIGTPAEIHERPRNRFVAGFFAGSPIGFVEGEVCRQSERWVLRRDLDTWPLPESAAARWRRWAGRRVALGFRPDCIRLVADAAEDADGRSSAWPATVVGAERSGNATLLNLKLEMNEVGERSDGELPPGESMVVYAWQPPGICAAKGRRVRIEWDAEQTDGFDAETGENLCVGRETTPADWRRASPD